MKPIPGQPHPDVAIVAHVLRQLKPGDVVTYAAVAKAIGLADFDPIGRRRATTARRVLRAEGIVVECSDQSFVRLDDVGILTRHSGRERKGINRKARRAGERLAAIDAVNLDANHRREFFAERTINNVVYMTTGHAAHKRLAIAIVASSMEVLPMARALEVLQNGGK